MSEVNPQIEELIRLADAANQKGLLISNLAINSIVELAQDPGNNISVTYLAHGDKDAGNKSFTELRETAVDEVCFEYGNASVCVEASMFKDLAPLAALDSFKVAGVEYGEADGVVLEGEKKSERFGTHYLEEALSRNPFFDNTAYNRHCDFGFSLSPIPVDDKANAILEKLAQPKPPEETTNTKKAVWMSAAVAPESRSV